MKQILKMAFLAVSVLGATVTFTSCGNDNDEPKGKEVKNGTEVNPLNVFTGGLPKSIAGMTIQTNEKGQVIAIMRQNGKPITFEYNDVSTHASEITPQVVMTVKTRDETYVCNLYLDRNGFVKHCDETETYEDEVPEKTTWDFTYNNDGQLLTIFRPEGGHETTTIKYSDGNIVETRVVSAKEPDENHTYKISYTSKSVPTPIVNKGCLMLFDTSFGIDMDEMTYAYYAGLLGKATKDLPITRIEDGTPATFIWTLNAQGYPISVKDPIEQEEYTFSW